MRCCVQHTQLKIRCLLKWIEMDAPAWLSHWALWQVSGSGFEQNCSMGARYQVTTLSCISHCTITVTCLAFLPYQLRHCLCYYRHIRNYLKLWMIVHLHTKSGTWISSILNGLWLNSKLPLEEQLQEPKCKLAIDCFSLSMALGAHETAPAATATSTSAAMLTAHTSSHLCPRTRFHPDSPAPFSSSFVSLLYCYCCLFQLTACSILFQSQSHSMPLHSLLLQSAPLRPHLPPSILMQTLLC